MSKNTYLILAAVVVLILAGVWFYGSNKPAQVQESSNNSVNGAQQSGEQAAANAPLIQATGNADDAVKAVLQPEDDQANVLDNAAPQDVDFGQSLQVQ